MRSFFLREVTTHAAQHAATRTAQRRTLRSIEPVNTYEQNKDFLEKLWTGRRSLYWASKLSPSFEPNG